MVTDAPPGSAAGEIAFHVAPNCSLTPRQAGMFFGFVCAGSFAIAGVFAANGLWPVLPFAGLEMAVLAYALRASLRRGRCTQTITLTDSEVRIVTRDPAGDRQAAFPRHWARARLVRSHGWHPSRLLIESHGRACEVGRLLTEEERHGLHRRLAGLVGRPSETPPLAAETSSFT
ncbi:MAG: DUF2244 domain-containing protein [Steroidobacteraceae bacterium]|jgi:uncharacterized membrane protein|nr:DUF2244 domain-containing protein [Steroidobacteraceae bacterium]